MTEQTTETDSTWKFTGKHMLAIMLVFFGVIISVNGYMAYVAMTSWTGLLARNGYVASQDFNGVLAEQKRQDKMGYKSELRFGPQGMKLVMRDRDDKPLTGLKVELIVGRPAHENDDQKLTLLEGEPGVYGKPLLLAAGQWNVDVIAIDTSNRRYHRPVLLYVEK